MAGKKLQLDIQIDGKLDPSVQAAFTKLANMAQKAAKQTKMDKIGVSIDKLAGVSQKITGAVVKSGLVIGGIIGAIGAKSISLASDLQEVQNVVDVTFGKNAQQVNEWSKTLLKGYGLSELSAKRYSSVMGAMLKSSGLADDQILGMSQNLTQLTGDFASFYNLQNDEAFDKIRSGISGETEPLKQLGIDMSVVNLEAFAMSRGIKKSYNAMTSAEKSALRYHYLLGVTNDAQGDFARTSGSYANQMKTMQENINTLYISIGTKLLPVITPMITRFNDFISTIPPEKIQEMTDKFAALASNGLQGISDFVVNVGPGIMDVINFVLNNSELIAAAIMGLVFVTTALTIAQWAFNAAQYASPAMWIILAIVAAVGLLITAFVYCWLKFEAFRNFLISAGQGIVEFFKQFGVAIFRGLTAPLLPFVEMVNMIIRGMNLIPGVNIPLIPTILDYVLPKYADGGILTKATALIAGEAGTETIVPHNNKPRSQALALNAARSTGLSLGGSNSITFSPTFIVQGGTGTTKEELKSAYDDMESRFTAFMDKYFTNKERVSYGV